MISEKEYREVMSLFATGVTIVSAMHESKPYGLTVNSFTSVSIRPPLILICIAKGKKAHAVIEKSSYFCVNILTKDQENLCLRFADPRIEDVRFEGVDYYLDEYGCPRIKGCLAYITCKNVLGYEGGDHTIFLAEVLKMDKGIDALPLIFFKRSYTTLKV